jgi:hypothetical protein
MPTVHVEEREESFEVSRESFDRMEFALRALSVVRPAGMTVALCASRSHLRVEAGRAWGRGEGQRWALVCIPPSASRESIVAALAALGGETGPGAGQPYALDVLLHRDDAVAVAVAVH